MKNNKKYVVLEHLMLPDRGFRFWSTNSDNNTHSFEGELWYKEVMFTDSAEEATMESGRFNRDAVPTYEEIAKYHESR